MLWNSSLVNIWVWTKETFSHHFQGRIVTGCHGNGGYIGFFRVFLRATFIHFPKWYFFELLAIESKIYALKSDGKKFWDFNLLAGSMTFIFPKKRILSLKFAKKLLFNFFKKKILNFSLSSFRYLSQEGPCKVLWQ